MLCRLSFMPDKDEAAPFGWIDGYLFFRDFLLQISVSDRAHSLTHQA